MKAVVAAFNQEKALVGAFSVITNLRMDLFEALQLSLSRPSFSSCHCVRFRCLVLSDSLDTKNIMSASPSENDSWSRVYQGGDTWPGHVTRDHMLQTPTTRASCPRAATPCRAWRHRRRGGGRWRPGSSARRRAASSWRTRWPVPWRTSARAVHSSTELYTEFY